MKKHTLWSAAGLALAAGIVALSPVACSSGGGGGAGVGIATLGVSAIFAGNSPGFVVRDPAQTDVNATADGVSTATPTAEPPIAVTAAQSVDRFVFAGGVIAGNTITIQGNATASTTNTALLVDLNYNPWSGAIGTVSFSPPGLLLATGSALIQPTATDFVVVLNFASVNLGAGQTLVGAQGNPADIYTLTFHTTGSVTINTTSVTNPAKVLYGSAMTRQTRFDFNAVTSGLDEHGTGTVVVSTTPSTPSACATTGPADLLATHTGTTFTPDPAGAQTRTVTANTGSEFAVDVEVGGQCLQGAAVVFTSPTQSVTVLSGANGVARAVLTFPNPTTTSPVLVNVTSGSGIASFLVNVTASAVRGGDDLDHIDVGLTGTTLGATISVVTDPCLKNANGAGTVTTIPTNVQFLFAENATSGALWNYNVVLRTESIFLASTATFRIDVLDATSGTVIATSGVIGNGTTTGPAVGANAQRYTGKMTQVAAGGDTVTATPSTSTLGALQVVLTAATSTDAATPGVQVITDDRVGNSFVFVPGPVVFATFDGSSSPASTAGKVMASQPDPRR
jgi:hypothetical protein